eukprot:TRINITY_DN2571_c0_g1_i2.p1 TRINITY_DN2571_c0_g1~~TRINITY_DN2571_c0_g1_i2.p1  ORF type:complete len:104 (-),score=48.61 TRINITY_DN2571_c0_g1_i2:77-343(-)
MADVEETKGIMAQNIDTMLQHHEKLQDIEEQSDTMAQQAQVFKKQATEIKNVMWWQNCKCIALMVVGGCIAVAIVLVVIVVPIVLLVK